jgi:hypothetical protein
MKRLILLFIIGLTSLNSWGQDIDGDWSGVLKMRNIQLRTILHIKKTEAGYSATMDIPDQKARDNREESVAFENRDDSLTLAGTLTLPQNESVFPAVVLISGSGPQNRDEELFGHKPFLVIADYLTRNGIAVLRYDDRGTAEFASTRQNQS